MNDIAIKTENKPTIRASVRGLVEFILRFGDINSSKKAATADAMQAGSRIHRKIQNAQGVEYHAEVPLSFIKDCGNYYLFIEGRADGIIDNIKNPNQNVVIDEIKGVYRDVNKLSEPEILHISQAKVYAAIYSEENDLEYINVRMTYVNLDSEQIRYFENEFKASDVQSWFYELLDEYRKWTDFEYNWKIKRQLSLKNLVFPFEYREGQKDLSGYVYKTIYHKKNLFIEAPTGVGKTISTVFPTLKAIGEGKAQRLFYLTAKTITATAAANTFKLLRDEQEIKFKTVQITAKEKMCPYEECNCTPEACEYAKGHYDRINAAIFDLLSSEDEYMRQTVLEYAEKHKVCPFEFCLDMSLFSDGIICDYNYLFDPNVYLRRFFAENVKGEYVFLIDEAHNLLDRAREMYSATIVKEEILEIKRLVKDIDKKLSRSLDRANKVFLELKRESDDVSVIKNIDDVIVELTRLQGRFESFLDEEEMSAAIGDKKDIILDFYFKLRHFLNMSDTLDESYVIYTFFLENGDFALKLFCIHPANHLRECIERGVSAIFFSATLLPMKYYMELLSNNETDYAVYAKSSFDPDKRGVYIAADVSSKYKRRGRDEYKRIAEYVVDITLQKPGNYIAFFPSYRFMEDVGQYIQEILQSKDTDINLLMQSLSMSEESREEFLSAFMDNKSDEKLLGLCVLGGIFSEGIDLKEDALIGSIIVGTGLPLVCTQRELMKDYFDRRGQNGFDYAYRFPGMNKVLQAAGRVIRTENDQGVVVLLDERFLQSDYRALFPMEWEKINTGRGKKLIDHVGQFWKELEG